LARQLAAYNRGDDPGELVYEDVVITERAVNGVEFDQPPSAPIRRLIICTTPRSGSYLLARQLIRAGIGIPHEYLNPANVSVIEPRSSGSYLGWLERNRTTPNGIFAAKLHWPQMEKHPEVINAWLRRPDTLCLFLHRRRLLSQAVSFRASLHSGVWDVGEEISAAPRAVPGLSENRETDHLAYRLIAWNGMWRFFFESNDIPVMDLAYEDFVADQSKTIADIGAKLGVACEVPAPEPYSGSGSKSDDQAQRRYLQTWAYPNDGAPPLRYSRRLAIGALIDSTRRGLTRRLRSVPGIFVKRR